MCIRDRVCYELQGGVSESVGDGSCDMSAMSGLVNDGSKSSMSDVRAGLNRVIQVFITHSANVFMVDCPPVVHATGRELTADSHVKLEDQVGLMYCVLCSVGPTTNVYCLIFVG